MKKPRVFISYAWEDEETNNWVQEFANTLMNNGIIVKFDRNDLTYGDSISEFIDNNIEKADYIIVICQNHVLVELDMKLILLQIK